jgi:glycosyltransferase involved in cell wall biosynthesis
VAALPTSFRDSLEQALRRRHDERIDTSHVRSHTIADIVSILSNRVAPPSFSERYTIWSDRLFDRRVARHIPPATELVVVQDGQALATIRAARRKGIPAILNQTTGFVLRAMETYREEARRHPDFADSLSSHLSMHAQDFMGDELREADHVLVPSAFARDTISEAGIDRARITMLPYGVDVTRFRPGWTPDSEGRFRVLYVGNISQKKGIKYLLEAIKQLDSDKISLILVGHIIGSGTGLAPYRHLFTHVPHVPYFKIHEMFHNADLFVYPSLHEGSAFANLEAMASGLPVVTTHNAGSVLRDGVDGFIVPIRRADAIAAHIDEMRRNPDKREAMGRSARARAEEFTWDHYGDNLDRLLRRFVERRQ